MLPNLYTLLRDASAVTAIIGSPPRFYPHGSAPQNVAAPYVTQRVIDAVPDLVLDDRPPVDACRIQVSCWSDNAGTGSAGIMALAEAVRDAIEPTHHIVDIRDMGRDFETQRYRIDFDVSVWNASATSSS